MAQAAITFTPLHHGEHFRPPGCPSASERIARLPVFCDAYGVERLALLHAVEEVQRVGLEELVEYGGQGISPYHGFFTGNEFRYQTWDYEWFMDNRTELGRALGR
ncbi:MAG: hypothetical protein M3450_12030 [Actinomycetota bacterium]|nr:hypothetical protein [Actinomycetota bacterium]